MAARHDCYRMVPPRYYLFDGGISRSISSDLNGQGDVLVYVISVPKTPFRSQAPRESSASVRQGGSMVPPARNGENR